MSASRSKVVGRAGPGRKLEEVSMPYAMFHARFPEVGERETRTVTVTREGHLGLPPGDFTFLEMYCDEPGCDCRRVFFNVMYAPTRKTAAVIAYGWESVDYYARWMGDDDPLALRELKGPVLNICSPQSDIAPAVLALFETILLEDPAYMERIQRHYRMFRDAIDGKAKAPRRGAKGKASGGSKGGGSKGGGSKGGGSKRRPPRDTA